MGASDRDRAEVMRPRPVLVDRSGHWRGERDWNVGLLLDVRQVGDSGGRSHWEGLVATARGGGELPWSLEVAWIRQDYLRRIGAPDPDSVPVAPPAGEQRAADR